jgi:hypothetical protein
MVNPFTSGMTFELSDRILLSTDHELILTGNKVLSAVRGEYRACRWTEDFLLVSDKET